MTLTLDDLIQQLEQAIQIAVEDRQPTAIIQATIAQAKLLGLDGGLKDVTPQNRLGHCDRRPLPLSPEVARAIDKALEDEY